MPKRDGYRFESLPVVSVRLDRDLLMRVDRLAEHTGRSRGWYLRRAIEACLPAFEGECWKHNIEDEQRQLNAKFLDIIAGLNDQDEEPGVED